METIKQTIAQNLGGPSHLLVPEHQQFSLEQVPSLNGKVAVVTGGSEGIGFGCTHTLLSHGIEKLFILSLVKDKADGAVEAIRSELGQDVAKKVTWIECDLSDWDKAKKVAEQISNSTDRLDILINNAGRGIMTYQLNDYGVDRHMALNHFGHVILTSHLLPLIKKTATPSSLARIVNLSSNLHENTPSDTKFASLEELNRDLGPNPQYGRSKLAELLYARYLARHLADEHPNIIVNASHPGIVETTMSQKDIHEPYPLGGYAMSLGLKPFKKDQFQGCVSTIFAATTTTGSGQYICPPAAIESGSALSRDEDLGEQLMKLTREVIKEKTGWTVEDY